METRINKIKNKSLFFLLSGFRTTFPRCST